MLARTRVVSWVQSILYYRHMVSKYWYDKHISEIMTYHIQFMVSSYAIIVIPFSSDRTLRHVLRTIVVLLRLLVFAGTGSLETELELHALLWGFWTVRLRALFWYRIWARDLCSGVGKTIELFVLVSACRSFIWQSFHGDNIFELLCGSITLFDGWLYHPLFTTRDPHVARPLVM